VGICLRSMIFTPSIAALGAGMAGGREERTGRPAGIAGVHPQDRNALED